MHGMACSWPAVAIRSRFARPYRTGSAAFAHAAMPGQCVVLGQLRVAAQTQLLAGRFNKNKLTEKKTCLTFDDSLRCQYDIALPVLEDLKIKSFFLSSS